MSRFVIYKIHNVPFSICHFSISDLWFWISIFCFQISLFMFWLSWFHFSCLWFIIFILNIFFGFSSCRSRFGFVRFHVFDDKILLKSRFGSEKNLKVEIFSNFFGFSPISLDFLRFWLRKWRKVEQNTKAVLRGCRTAFLGSFEELLERRDFA